MMSQGRTLKGLYSFCKGIFITQSKKIAIFWTTPLPYTVLPLVGGQGGHPEFGRSVNPITTRGAEYAHHITASPPGFEILAASLCMDTRIKLLVKVHNSDFRI